MHLYLVDFTDRILEKRSVLPAEPIDVTGRYPIQVPVALDQQNLPTNVAALIASKHEKIASALGFFSNYVYDDMQTDSYVDTLNSYGVSLSPRVGMCIQPPVSGPCIFYSTVLTLGIAPSQALVLCEPFFYEDSDPKVGRFQRSFVLPTENNVDAALTVRLSFDGGATTVAFIPGQITSIPLANQGTDLVVSFERASGTKRLFIGSWTVLYL